MKKLYLKKHEKYECIREDQHSYELKETDCGRYFIWKSKYPKGHEKVDTWTNRFSYQDFDTTEEFHKAVEVREKETEKNKLIGTCFELARTSYDYLLEQEKESEKYLESNKQHLGNPMGVQIYPGTPEENAKKYYKKKDNAEPYGWSGVVHSGHRNTWYIIDMQERSDRFYDENNKEILYDREFFDSITFNNSNTKKALDELKKLIEEKSGPMEWYKEYENCEDSRAIRKFTAERRLGYYFKEKTAEMKKELKKVLPKDNSILNDDIYYEIKFNSRSKKVRFSAYSSIK